MSSLGVSEAEGQCLGDGKSHLSSHPLRGSVRGRTRERGEDEGTREREDGGTRGGREDEGTRGRSECLHFFAQSTQ